MTDWVTDLDRLQDFVWSHLDSAANERAQISFATVDADGMPENRTVVLRGCDTRAGILDIYTDLQSDKISSLRHTAKAAILHWDADLALQVRAQCDVAILSGETVMDRWREIPDHSRLSYGVTPPPGTVLPDSTAYTKSPDRDVFAVLSCTVTHLDAVHLGDPHRRAAFRRDGASNTGDWQANWLAP